MALDPALPAVERGPVARKDRAGVLDLFEALRRRVGPMLLVLIVGVSLAGVAAWFWPATYRSTGVILIEQQEMPEDFVRSAVSSYADQRVQVIGQRVMTSANLLSIAHKFSLYEAQTPPSRESVLKRLRKDIRLEMISADVMDPNNGRPTKATIAFSVGYDSPSPRLASEVATELASLYMRANIESRQQLAASTVSFLNEEAQKLGSRVAELENKIAQFKEANRDALPERGEFNMQVRSRTEEDLRNNESRSRLLDQQIVYLEAQMAQVTPSSLYVSEGGERILSPADRLKIARTEYASASAVYSGDHPTVKRLKREIEGLELEVRGPALGNDVERALTDARGELASLRERYSADHPDVLAAQRRIVSLEGQMKSANASRVSASQSRSDVADNPAYIQLQSQKHAAEQERSSLVAEKAELRSKLQGFDSRMAQSPGVERDYNSLLRDFESEKAKYAEVRQKQMEAQLASNLETERKGERFTLIEPPRVPEAPVSPNRLAMLVLGCGLALPAAVGLGLILEALDTRIRGRRGIVALLDTPPLAVIPWVATRRRA